MGECQQWAVWENHTVTWAKKRLFRWGEGSGCTSAARRDGIIHVHSKKLVLKDHLQLVSRRAVKFDVKYSEEAVHNKKDHQNE